VPLTLVVLAKVGADDSGIASSLLNTGQQVGGAIGLAALGTVTWAAVSRSVKSQLAHAGTGGGAAGVPRPPAGHGAAASAPVLHQALAYGISRGFLVAAGIAALALVIVIASITIRRDDFTSPQAMAGASAAEDQGASSNPI
jgi:hypothetical protein